MSQDGGQLFATRDRFWRSDGHRRAAPPSVAPAVPIALTPPLQATWEPDDFASAPDFAHDAPMNFDHPPRPSNNRLEPTKDIAAEPQASLTPKRADSPSTREKPIELENRTNNSAPAPPKPETRAHPTSGIEPTRFQAPKALRRTAPPPAADVPAIRDAAASQPAAHNPAAVAPVAPVTQPVPAPMKVLATPAATTPMPPAEPRNTPPMVRESSNASNPSAAPALPPQPPREGAALPTSATLSRSPGRISIGRIDVQVHNRPAVPARVLRPSRPSAGVSQSSPSEGLGLDRFAMKP